MREIPFDDLDVYILGDTFDPNYLSYLNQYQYESCHYSPGYVAKATLLPIQKIIQAKKMRGI